MTNRRHPLDRVFDAVNATEIPFAKYAWAKRPEGVEAWGQVGMDGEDNSLWSDGRMTDQVLEGTVDLFVRDDGPRLMQLVQQALNSLDISWELYLVLYEKDEKLIHYQWVWRD